MCSAGLGPGRSRVDAPAALYIGVRAFDGDPDRTLAFLTRRDSDSASDWIRVLIDSSHDRRTAYEFMVNPAGVKRDKYYFNDNNDDESWDAVWDVAVQRTRDGWSAEFRILTRSCDSAAARTRRWDLPLPARWAACAKHPPGRCCRAVPAATSRRSASCRGSCVRRAANASRWRRTSSARFARCRARGTEDAQWVTNLTGPEDTHYVLGRPNQTTTHLTLRLSYTLTPNLSLQLYGQPFSSTGRYADYKELVNGRAEHYVDRYAPFAYDGSGREGFRPGSQFRFGRDYGDMFPAPSSNTVLVKLSYWLNP